MARLGLLARGVIGAVGGAAAANLERIEEEGVQKRALALVDYKRVNALELQAIVAENNLNRDRLAPRTLGQNQILTAGGETVARGVNIDPVSGRPFPGPTPEAEGQAAGAEAFAKAEEQARLLGLEGDAATDFVTATLAPSGGDKAAALERLVGQGILDQDTADKIAAGVLVIRPVLNDTGQVIGNEIFDLSQIEGQPRAVPSVPAGAPAAAIPSAAPGAAARVPPIEPAVPPTPTAAAPEVGEQEPQTLWEILTGPTAVTGIAPAVIGGAQRIAGQVGLKIAEAEQQLLRRRFNNSQLALTRALIPAGDRFSQVRIDLIFDKTDIDAEAFKDRQTLASNVVALDQDLSIFQEQAERDADNEDLPTEVRRAQGANAAAFRNFRASMGVPPGTTAEDIEAIPAPTRGGFEEVLDFVKGLVSGPTLPSPSEIDAMTAEQLNALIVGIPVDTPITTEQLEAIQRVRGTQ